MDDLVKGNHRRTMDTDRGSLDSQGGKLNVAGAVQSHGDHASHPEPLWGHLADVKLALA